MNKKIKNSRKKAETAKANESNSSKSASAETSTDTGAASSTTQTEKKTKTKKETASQELGDCDIKGSVNRIYHVPGSTYYNRTKMLFNGFVPLQRRSSRLSGSE